MDSCPIRISGGELELVAIRVQKRYVAVIDPFELPDSLAENRVTSHFPHKNCCVEGTKPLYIYIAE